MKITQTQITTLQIIGLEESKIDILKKAELNLEVVENLGLLGFDENIVKFLKTIVSKEDDEKENKVEKIDMKDLGKDKKDLSKDELNFLAVFRESNNLTETKRLGYDLISSKYFYHNLESNRIEFYAKHQDDIKKLIQENCSNFSTCSNKFVEAVKNEIKATRVVFNKNKGSFYEEFGDSYYNTYEDSKYIKMAKSIQSKKIETVEELFKDLPAWKLLFNNIVAQDEEALNYVVNWVAASFKEKEKLPTALFFHGIGGTGKDLWYQELFIRAFGEKMCAQIGNEELNSQFNGWAENRLSVLANEVKEDYKMSSGLSNKLKELITKRTVNVNVKFGRQYEANNFFNMIFFSNLDEPLALDASDRRFSMIRTSDVPLKKLVESLGLDLSKFIEKLRNEFTKFFIRLWNFKYDVNLVKWTLDTESKRNIIQNTNTKIDIISANLKNRDFDFIKEKFELSIEGKEQEFGGWKNILESIKNEMEFGRIKVSDLAFVYNLVIDDELKNKNKISQKWSKTLGESFNTRGTDGKHSTFKKLETRTIDLEALKLDFSVKDETEETILSEDDIKLAATIKTEEERITLDKEDLLNLIENNSFDLEDLSANSLCVKIDDKIYCTENLTDEETDKFISILSK